MAKPGFGQEYAPVQAGLEHGSWCFNLLGRVPNTNNVICARMENPRAEEASGLCLCCIFSAASGWRWRLREGAGADTRGCCSRADGHIALLAHQNAPFAISAPGQQGLCRSAPRGSVNLVLEQPEHLEFTCTEVMKVPITFLSPPILLWLFEPPENVLKEEAELSQSSGSSSNSWIWGRAPLGDTWGGIKGC